MHILNILTTTVLTWTAVLILAWLFGGRILRLAGMGGVALGALYLYAATSFETATPLSYVLSAITVLIGVVLWLSGHRLSAAQQGRWSSAAAETLWCAVARRVWECR